MKARTGKQYGLGYTAISLTSWYYLFYSNKSHESRTINFQLTFAFGLLYKLFRYIQLVWILLSNLTCRGQTLKVKTRCRSNTDPGQIQPADCFCVVLRLRIVFTFLKSMQKQNKIIQQTKTKEQYAKETACDLQSQNYFLSTTKKVANAFITVSDP